jgi:hypothetical protein
MHVEITSGNWRNGDGKKSEPTGADVEAGSGQRRRSENLERELTEIFIKLNYVYELRDQLSK